ncbi:hypothetical protein [Campylobacter majalis]|uniref:hypothetical protein n=1 Tax=Campylobacter majalis TaxID=2790656 RepID=UPI003D6800C6
MRKFFIYFAFLCIINSAFATPPDFNPSHEFELKKDEWARVIIIEKASNIKEIFDFRWTLFDTTNITVQSFFRRFPRHMSMSLRHGQNRYVQRILPDFNKPPNDGVKLYLSFIDFKNKKAKFRVDILDIQKKIDVEFVSPRRSENE